jgi:hypothetical protein
MIEQGSQFTCPQCGKPQFTADFGFEKHNHAPGHVEDPCVFCGESTAPGGMNRVDPNDPESVHNLLKNLPLMNSKFINRIPYDGDNYEGKHVEGYACADCMSEPCTKCKQIVPFGEEHDDEYGNKYHEECIDPKKHANWCCS